MKIAEIYQFLDELSPFELQEKWDNSGLLLGDFNQEIDTVVLSIDIDEALVERLEDNTLVITHHPIIFGGLKQLRFNEYPAKLLQRMIQKILQISRCIPILTIRILTAMWQKRFWVTP